MKRLAVFLIFLCCPANAQQAEQVGVIVQFYINCTVANGPTSNQVVFLQNYVDQPLPSPLLITQTFAWNEMGAAGEQPAGAAGNITFAIDPGMVYVKSSGFPQIQNNSPQFFKSLAAMEFFPNGSNQSWKNFQPPIGYRSGDALIVAPECTGLPLLNFYLDVNFQSTSGDLTPLSAMPAGGSVGGYRTTYNTPADATYVGFSGTISFRNAIPGQAGSSIRVHANSGPQQATKDTSVASHVSVCIQAAAGSPNCASTPVELTFNGLSGYYLGPGMVLWSDWVPFTVTAGQTLLVIDSFTGASNGYGYKAVSSYSSWYSTVDGWNSSTMPGTISFQPTRTYAVDAVQQQ